MFKKIILFSIVGLILFLIPVSIYAQIEEDVPFPFSYTQSTVRNSDGALIVYQENYSPRLENTETFHLFLDAEKNSEDSNVTLFDISGSTYELIQFETKETFSSDQLRAWDNLLGSRDAETVSLAIFFHEGYPVLDGDDLTINWAFIRLER